MAESDSRKVIVRCRCGAKLAVEPSPTRRRVKCPRCNDVLEIEAAHRLTEPVSSPSADPAEAQKTQDASDPQRRVVHCSCGAKLRVAAGAAGASVRCPRCKTKISVPAAAEFEAVPSLLDDLVCEAVASPKLADTETDSPASSVSSPAAEIRNRMPSPTSPQAGRACPGCKRILPKGAVVCVNCGMNLKSGRRLLTSDVSALDSVHATAETLVTYLSWLIWLGIYPIASEGFGTRKPHVVRGLSILTTLVSFWFFVDLWSHPDGDLEHTNLMLWGGHSMTHEEMIDNLRAESESAGYELDENELSEAAAEVRQQTAGGQFHGYQLLTHALLHMDLMHLAGNMLFLLVFGSRVNALVGNVWTAGLYPLLAVAAGVAHCISVESGALVPMLGASGAVMGLAGMYFVFFPVHKVHMVAWWRWGLIGGFNLSFKAFAVRGFWVVLFYISFDVIYTVFTSLQDNVAHWAHLGGFIAGAVVAVILLLTGLVDARGGDLLSRIMGRSAAIFVKKTGGG